MRYKFISLKWLLILVGSFVYKQVGNNDRICACVKIESKQNIVDANPCQFLCL